MFDYTKAAFKQTVEDFKKIDFIRNIATQVLYIAYLVYVLCTSVGLLVANILLLVLAVGYFGFFLFMTLKPPTKRVKEIIKTIFTRSRQLIKLYTLGVMVYGVWLTAEHVTPLALILSSLMIVCWVLQILFEVVFKFFLNRANFIIEGMEADYENMTKPVRTVGNFFKKMTGQEVEEEKAPTKNRIILDQKVALAREERKRQKQAEADERILRAEREKQARKEQKAEARAAKKAKNNTLNEDEEFFQNDGE